jgi:hypothetical protein
VLKRVKAVSRLMPHDRMAISSLSEESLPTAIRIPNSRDIGMVSTTMFGRVYSSSSPTIDTGRPRRMIISADSNRNRKRRMKV